MNIMILTENDRLKKEYMNSTIYCQSLGYLLRNADWSDPVRRGVNLINESVCLGRLVKKCKFIGYMTEPNDQYSCMTYGYNYHQSDLVYQYLYEGDSVSKHHDFLLGFMVDEDGEYQLVTKNKDREIIFFTVNCKKGFITELREPIPICAIPFETIEVRKDGKAVYTEQLVAFCQPHLRDFLSMAFNGTVLDITAYDAKQERSLFKILNNEFI